MNELDRKGIKLVNELYKDLYKSSDVMRKVSFKHVTEKQNNVKYYFDRLDKIHDEKYIDRIKSFYYDRYVIKEENIDTRYLPMGSTKEDIIKVQKENLSEWIDYLSDKNANYPTWTKYVVFQTMLKIGTYNEANNSYYKRNKTTTSNFIKANPTVIAEFISYLTRYVNKEEMNDVDIQKLLENKSLDKLLVVLSNRNKQEILNNGFDGIWKKYNKGTEDYIELSEDIKPYNTGWCTADVSTAKSQIKNGDFHVYYTKNNNGNYKIPRIAIRMYGSHNVAEIRGVEVSQNLEEGLEETVLEKLKEIKVNDIDNQMEKINNSKKLTLLNQKSKRQEEFTEEEIAFLYELNARIETFGWGTDPRIEKIISTRNKVDDYKKINSFNKKLSFLTKHIDKTFDGVEENEKVCKKVLRHDGKLIRIAKNQTQELCMTAINYTSSALQNVKEQTSEICIAAVMQNGYALKYVREQTPEICMAAVKQNGYTLCHVKKQTPEICIAAVEEDGYSLQFVKNQTPEICMAAVRQRGNVIYLVKNQTEEICMAAVEQNGLALQYVKEQTPEICKAAVQQNYYALKFVKEKTPELYMIAKRNRILRHMKELKSDIATTVHKIKENMTSNVRKNNLPTEDNIQRR